MTTVTDPAHPATVYALFNADDEIIYVGCSQSLIQRLFDHQRRQGWWTEVSRASFFHFATLEEARAKEADVIRRVNPVYNVQHRDHGLRRAPSTMLVDSINRPRREGGF